MSETKVKDNSEKKLGIFIIANAIVWGLVMIAISLILKGTDFMDKLIPILAAGSALSVVFFPALLIKKKK